MATRDELIDQVTKLINENVALVALRTEIQNLRAYTNGCTAALALYRDRENWIVDDCENELTGEDFQIWQWAPHGEYADGTEWATAALDGTLTDYEQPELGLGEEQE